MDDIDSKLEAINTAMWAGEGRPGEERGGYGGWVMLLGDPS